MGLTAAAYALIHFAAGPISAHAALIGLVVYGVCDITYTILQTKTRELYSTSDKALENSTNADGTINVDGSNGLANVSADEFEAFLQVFMQVQHSDVPSFFPTPSTRKRDDDMTSHFLETVALVGDLVDTVAHVDEVLGELGDNDSETSQCADFPCSLHATARAPRVFRAPSGRAPCVLSALGTEMLA